MKQLTDFILSEREQYPVEGNNRFTFSLGQPARYEFFLRLIADRYRQVSADYLRASTAFQEEIRRATEASQQGGTIPIDEGSAWHDMSRLSQVVHLETESFYLFAKIFLDRIAQFIEHHFGPERGMSLASHDKMTKWFLEYANAKGLKYPDDLFALLALLKAKISDYRDYEIAHDMNPRTLHATTWTPDGAVRMVKTRLYPKPYDVQKESGDVSELLGLLDSYTDFVMKLVVDNRAKSRHLRAPPPVADGHGATKGSADPRAE